MSYTRSIKYINQTTTACIFFRQKYPVNKQQHVFLTVANKREIFFFKYNFKTESLTVQPILSINVLRIMID